MQDSKSISSNKVEKFVNKASQSGSTTHTLPIYKIKWSHELHNSCDRRISRSSFRE